VNVESQPRVLILLLLSQRTYMDLSTEPAGSRRARRGAARRWTIGE
jgi:hypothetical protein